MVRELGEMEDKDWLITLFFRFEKQGLQGCGRVLFEDKISAEIGLKFFYRNKAVRCRARMSYDKLSMTVLDLFGMV